MPSEYQMHVNATAVHSVLYALTARAIHTGHISRTRSGLYREKKMSVVAIYGCTYVVEIYTAQGGKLTVNVAAVYAQIPAASRRRYDGYVFKREGGVMIGC